MVKNTKINIALKKNSESNFASKVHQLNQMLKEKDKEIDLLKKAAAFFAKKIDS